LTARSNFPPKSSHGPPNFAKGLVDTEIIQWKKGLGRAEGIHLENAYWGH